MVSEVDVYTETYSWNDILPNLDKSSEYDLKDFSNVLQSFWYLQLCVSSFEEIWRILEWESKTLVQHLANRTNWEM